jgi:hypothetical protein
MQGKWKSNIIFGKWRTNIRGKWTTKPLGEGGGGVFADVMGGWGVYKMYYSLFHNHAARVMTSIITYNVARLRAEKEWSISQQVYVKNMHYYGMTSTGMNIKIIFIMCFTLY